jgi:hypothetical protein
MTTPQIDYASLVEKALLRVVRDVLATVAEEGLPGRHHLYITFRTDHPGVVIDDTLRARYPTEMTIVLQHEFWGLEVEDAGFAITLKFNGVPQRLEIPFDAVTVFADPSVEFGLQFTRAAESEGEPAPAPVQNIRILHRFSGVECVCSVYWLVSPVDWCVGSNGFGLLFGYGWIPSSEWPGPNRAKNFPG